MKSQDTMRKLRSALEVTEWAMGQGFDAFELRMAWDSWLDEIFPFETDPHVGGFLLSLPDTSSGASSAGGAPGDFPHP